MALKGRFRQSMWLLVSMMVVYFICHTLIASTTYVIERGGSDLKESRMLPMDGDAKDRMAETLLNVFEDSLVTLASEGTTYLPPQKPLLVLLLSSMPRSGSTLLAEVLANIEESILFFEPLWTIGRKPECMKNEKCVTQFMRDVFTCSYPSDFESWLKSKTLFLKYFNSEANHCYEMKDTKAKGKCIKDIDLQGLCNAAPIRLMKVIRARMRWMKSFLEDPELNFKIIHLTRDPRGSLNSIRKFKWDSDPLRKCSGLEDDFVTFDSYNRLFPSKVLQLHYEDFCLNPQEVTKDIMNFLFGIPSIPPKVKSFLDEHMGMEVQGAMSTFKDAKKQFDAWRYKIDPKVMLSIENEPTCLSSIRRMEHTVFGSKERAINSSISLLPLDK